MNRRQFTTALGLALAGGGSDLAAQKTKPRKLRCGHTGITWGFRPEDAERAIADVASLGYHGYESFGKLLGMGTKGGLDKLLRSAKLPLRSAYCPVNLTDPRFARRKSRSW